MRVTHTCVSREGPRQPPLRSSRSHTLTLNCGGAMDEEFLDDEFEEDAGDASTDGFEQAVEQAQAEPEVECTICQEGTEEGPLEDACGHSHLLHPGCAAMWRARCVEQHRQDPLKFAAPHCPTCRRPI